MFSVNIDVSEIANLVGETRKAADMAMQEAARNLTAMTHAKIVELAGSKLHSRRQMFVDGLSYQQVAADTWLINLDAKVRWIDDGMPAHNMLDDLLKSKKAKTAKDGSRYVVVPFNHGPGKGASNSTPAQMDLVATIKSEMKRKNIPFGTIEKDASGQAKTGRLHSFDIMKEPLKTANGPGQGHGPIGDVRQGPNQRQNVGGGPGGGGTPFLQGVSVYQNKVKDRFGNTSVKRSIMTFRVASSKHKEQGNRWNHPGTDPMNILEDAAKWAMETFDREIAPGIIAKVVAMVG